MDENNTTQVKPVLMTVPTANDDITKKGSYHVKIFIMFICIIILLMLILFLYIDGGPYILNHVW
jgi:hypothetical protein